MLGTKRWDSGFEQHYGIKNSDGIRGDCGCNQAICLEEMLVADEFGCKRDVTVWGCLFMLLYFDSHRWCNTKHSLSL